MNKGLNILLFLLLILSNQLSVAETIKLGMSAAITGPSAALGINLRHGIESYFKLINAQGGVDNRLLELIVRDDGYEPERAATNMRKLIDEDKVLAVLANVGTPTAIVTVPIAQEKKTLLFGAFSGAEVLRSLPTSRYIMNYRASYYEEIMAMIEGILASGIKAEQIAFFTQRDGFGEGVYQGAVKALQQQGFQNIFSLTHGRYSRNTVNVEDAVAVMLDAQISPKVVIMAGADIASAKFITLLKQEIVDVWFVNISFVGSHSLLTALKGNNKQVVVSQVVPELNSSLAIIKEYTDCLSRFNTELTPNDVSLEGYIIAKIFHQGLLNIEGDINKESIINGLEYINDLDIGLGSNINYNKTEHQAIHKLWLTSLDNGKIELFKWAMMLGDDYAE